MHLLHLHPSRPLNASVHDEQLERSVGGSEDKAISLSLPVRLGLLLDLLGISSEGISYLVVRSLLPRHSIDFEHILFLNKFSRVCLILDKTAVRQSLVDLPSSLGPALLGDAHVRVLALEAEEELLYGISGN